MQRTCFLELEVLRKALIIILPFPPDSSWPWIYSEFFAFIKAPHCVFSPLLPFLTVSWRTLKLLVDFPNTIDTHEMEVICIKWLIPKQSKGFFLKVINESWKPCWKCKSYCVGARRQTPSGHWMWSQMCVIKRNIGLKHCSYLVCDIIYYNDSMGTSVVAGRDCTKPLLTCSIPLSKRTQKKTYSFNVFFQQ